MKKTGLNNGIKMYFGGVILAAFLLTGCTASEPIMVNSPDGANTFQLSVTDQSTTIHAINFLIRKNGTPVLLPSEIKITSREIDFISPFSINKVEESSVENEWTTDFGERKIIPDNYNQVKVFLESATARLNLICRAYNEGVAFAYEIPRQGNFETISIDEESITYKFSKDYNVWSTPK
ncbi:MAG: hypothetical protein DWQ10_11210, partial [Calditrichaeota bacterium]